MRVDKVNKVDIIMTVEEFSKIINNALDANTQISKVEDVYIDCYDENRVKIRAIR